MTYIHSTNNKNILNFILGGLVFASLVGVFSLVTLYNKVVDLNHSISAAKTELDSVGAKNTSLNNQLIVALHSIESSNLAAQQSLIEDKHPEYLSLNQSWPIASQR